MKTPLTPLLLLLCAGAAFGQSASSFVPQAAAGEPAPSAVDQADPDLASKPSRFAGLHVDSYVRTIIGSLSIGKRQTDPFGLHQDPNYKPPKPKRQLANRPTVKKAPQLSFGDIVGGIEINAVIPGKQTFLVGDRSFRVGDRIPLDVRGRMLTVQVIAVSTDSVSFRNTLSGETANIRLSIAPGMSKGEDVPLPPGFVPEGRNAPLSITPTNGLSTNR